MYFNFVKMKRIMLKTEELPEKSNNHRFSS